MRRVDVEETSPDDVVGRDEVEPFVLPAAAADNKNAPDPEGCWSRRCDVGRGDLSSVQSSMTVRRRDWGLDSDPYS